MINDLGIKIIVQSDKDTSAGVLIGVGEDMIGTIFGGKEFFFNKMFLVTNLTVCGFFFMAGRFNFLFITCARI